MTKTERMSAIRLTNLLEDSARLAHSNLDSTHITNVIIDICEN